MNQNFRSSKNSSGLVLIYVDWFICTKIISQMCGTSLRISTLYLNISLYIWYRNRKSTKIVNVYVNAILITSRVFYSLNVNEKSMLILMAVVSMLQHAGLRRGLSHRWLSNIINHRLPIWFPVLHRTTTPYFPGSTTK